MPDRFEHLKTALIDRYLLERELGRGGMATVYLAQDRKHHRPVAVKVLHPELAYALGADRFLREIEVAARLAHPHVLPLHDSGEVEGLLYYVMPWVDGESLRDRLNRDKQLPVEEAVQIASDVAAALAYAHGQGVVHRDIKPENILLEGDEAVVADFGIAQAVEQADAQRLTETGVAVGTAAYMSPEQSTGQRQLDGRSDVYSLGCVLYEMLSGEPPYTGPTVQAIVAKRFSDPVPSVHRVRPAVGPALDAAVSRALAPVPADRWPTAQAFRQQLTAISHSSDAGPEQVTFPAAPATPRQRRLRPVLLALGLAVLLLALGYAVLGRRSGGDAPGSASAPKMLAVLPFKNMGRTEDEYFADGLTEEITSRLASVRGLGVISRTSADQYKGTTKPLKQIGQELGAGYVLEGSVRWDKGAGGQSRVRVTPQLIQVSDDRHLWAARYDAVLADVFQVQSTIAEQVTGALGVAIGEPEHQALGARPTENFQAYDFYLKAKNAQEACAVTLAVLCTGAEEMFQKAISLDSTFALAYADLSRLHSSTYASHMDPSPARLAKAKAAADAAIRFRPDLAQSHIAQGSYHVASGRDFEAALREYKLAEQAQPNNAEVIGVLAGIELARGRWQDALERDRRVAELDPRSFVSALIVANLAYYMRRYAEAERYVERSLALQPANALGYGMKAGIHVSWHGDTARARRVVEEAIAQEGVGISALLGAMGTQLMFVIPRDSAFRAKLDRITAEELGDGDPTWAYLWKAEWYRHAKQPELARSYADSARVLLERQLAQQDQYFLRGRLALAYAQLGRKADAVRENRKSIDLAPIQKDLEGADRSIDLASVNMLIGEPEAALDQLEYLMSVPSQISPAWLRVDPLWAPLRSHPRFQRLLQQQD
jgi:serine/threonine-protein kinase